MWLSGYFSALKLQFKRLFVNEFVLHRYDVELELTPPLGHSSFVRWVRCARARLPRQHSRVLCCHANAFAELACNSPFHTHAVDTRVAVHAK